MADAEPTFPGEDATDTELKEYYCAVKLLDLKALFRTNGKYFAEQWRVKVYLRSVTRVPCNTYYMGPQNSKYSSLKQVKEAYQLQNVRARRISVVETPTSAASQEGASYSDSGSDDETTTDSDTDGETTTDDNSVEPPNVTPVIQLPEVEIVTGEEDWVTLFEEHTKLYRLDRTARQWRLRGKGWAYIQRNDETFRYRFLFREDATLAVRANHCVVPGLPPTLGDGQSSVFWTCTDFADGQAAPGTHFALAFDCADLAQNFKLSYMNAMDDVRFRDVDSVPLPADDEGPTVSEQRLHVLDLDELKNLSYKLGIRPLNNKAAAIKALREAELKYGELVNMAQMKLMLAAEGHLVSGRRAHLVRRLIETHVVAGSGAAGAAKYESYYTEVHDKVKKEQDNAYDEMLAVVERNCRNELTTDAFRRIMDNHGLLERDMDVCHIIARSNGGANHPDNYHLLGGKFNRRIGRYGDSIMCYLVGVDKAVKAVEVSRRDGNSEYGRYRGMSAEMLFEEGSRKFTRVLTDVALDRKPGLR